MIKRFLKLLGFSNTKSLDTLLPAIIISEHTVEIDESQVAILMYETLKDFNNFWFHNRKKYHYNINSSMKITELADEYDYSRWGFEYNNIQLFQIAWYNSGEFSLDYLHSTPEVVYKYLKKLQQHLIDVQNLAIELKRAERSKILNTQNEFLNDRKI